MFVTYIYQPFFNILVGLYWLLGKIGPEFADMGVAVILFSLVIRVLLFPLTLAGERSEEEKKKISDRVTALKQQYSSEPIKLRAEIKQVMKGNLRTVFATTANLIIQLIIIIMLYRIFTTGLEGADFHLLYDFMPHVNHVNLLFLGKFDLTHTNPILNLYQSLMIFIVEFLIALRSPLPVSRRDVILLQVILPLGSYIFFIFMPSGKKVFIITSLIFSAIYNSARLLQTWSRKLFVRLEPDRSATLNKADVSSRIQPPSLPTPDSTDTPASPTS